MLIRPLVALALKREVELFGESFTNKNNSFSIKECVYFFLLKQVPVVDSVKCLNVAVNKPPIKPRTQQFGPRKTDITLCN